MNIKPYSVSHILCFLDYTQILSHLQAINTIIFINTRYLGNFRKPRRGCTTLQGLSKIIFSNIEIEIKTIVKKLGITSIVGKPEYFY